MGPFFPQGKNDRYTCRGDHFWPQGHNLNKIGRGPLDDATYQISRPCGFRQEDFQGFHFENLFLACVT